MCKSIYFSDAPLGNFKNEKKAAALDRPWLYSFPSALFYIFYPLADLGLLDIEESLVLHPLVTVHLAHIAGTVIREQDDHFAVRGELPFQVQLEKGLYGRSTGISCENALGMGDLAGHMGTVPV